MLSYEVASGHTAYANGDPVNFIDPMGLMASFFFMRLLLTVSGQAQALGE